MTEHSKQPQPPLCVLGKSRTQRTWTAATSTLSTLTLWLPPYLINSSPILFVVFQHSGPKHVHKFRELFVHKGSPERKVFISLSICSRLTLTVDGRLALGPPDCPTSLQNKPNPILMTFLLNYASSYVVQHICKARNYCAILPAVHSWPQCPTLSPRKTFVTFTSNILYIFFKICMKLQ